MINKLSNHLMLLSAVCLMFVSLTTLFLSPRKETGDNGYQWKVEYSKGQAGIYLDGPDLENVLGSDIYLYSTDEGGKNVFVEAGDFLPNIFTVRWNNESKEYSLVKNPTVTSSNNIERPILIVRTTEPIHILPQSMIYVSGQGGIYPR